MSRHDVCLWEIVSLRMRLFPFAGPVRRIWGFPMSLQMLGKDCASPRVLRGVVDNTGEARGVDEEIFEGCHAMIQHFQQLCNQKKVTLAPCSFCYRC